ncbi:phosphate signaling complex protein PhoU [Corynebacterium pseudotuberculosis]|uniref:phosphate signaling complex protein PhoU n=1 Tax=Corynebacterium pseudotuberculosis TaxID=1719 RepID=UPI000719077E|nr:phosphate signaling complex protein PhoU [Corynebacterium pseudotuberculosis]ALP33614.1 Phosphate uptake regulator [Corynebacterium pseudotuberculosis]ALR34291.1 Phosphate uptake regulator [Corynebacterium pseudotuberculosis]APX36650.1 phosphate transport system regulatory protein PhoU [Corynebacterium pseudotuberculosis]APX38196.1 phosphate transport system regulatory protein PhoU [Corynebacterium pseudotuberculosis]AQL51821.1 Phosphate transport system regulatory protein PhoU [Corynebacte
MRTAYREHLDAFSHDLIVMCDTVTKILRNASKGLMEQSLQATQAALSLSDEMEEIKTRSSKRAVQLLALEAPVARDLRQIVSSIYIVEDLDRMAKLAMHIASIARRRYPESAIPEPITGYFQEMCRLSLEMSEKIRSVLIDPDADVALVLSADDDAVDDLHDHLMGVLTKRDWPHSTREAVDVTLLARYFERFADHTVNVAAQIVYLTSGLMPEEYQKKRNDSYAQDEMERRFSELEKQFSNFDWPKPKE